MMLADDLPGIITHVASAAAPYIHDAVSWLGDKIRERGQLLFSDKKAAADILT